MTISFPDYRELAQDIIDRRTNDDDGLPGDPDRFRLGMGIAPEIPEQVNTLKKFLLSGAVSTVDEATNTARLLPCSVQNPERERWRYMEMMITDYDQPHQIWACEKSRRMMATWLLCSVYIYRLMTVPHARYFVGARNFDKSCFLLSDSRIKGIYDNIPSDIWPNKPRVKFEYKSATGYQIAHCLDTDSWIEAMWEGPDVLRQYTVSAAWFDEFAFWRFAAPLWKGARSTISGGGRIDITSTPQMGSFMYRLLYRPEQDWEVINTGERKSQDEKQLMALKDAGIIGVRNYEAKQLMEGVEVRDTASGIHVIRLHYTADPAKRTDAWREREQIGVSLEDWRQEFEIDWMAGGGGIKIFNGFRENFHVSTASVQVDATMGGTFVRGWDFGNTPVAVICWQSPNTQLYVLDCVATWDGLTAVKSGNIAELAPQVINYCNINWPGVKWIDYVDPSGSTKAPTDGKSCIQLMGDAGIEDVRPGPMLFQDRSRAMIDILERNVGGEPKLVINVDCEIIKQAFRGGYRWREMGKNSGRISENVLKNAWSHPMDALQYVVGGLFMPKSQRAVAVKAEPWSPEAVYGRGKRRSGARF